MGSAPELSIDYEPPEALRRRLKGLGARANGPGLRRLAIHVGTLGFTAGAIALASGTFLVIPAMALHGAVLVFLFAPLHETIHRTAFRSRWINDVVATVCGFLLVLPAEEFRAFHFAHHRFTQDPMRDPELAGGALERRSQWLFRLTGLPYWRDSLKNIIRHASGAAGEPYVAPALARSVVREARVHLAFYGACLAAMAGVGWTAPFWYWVGPALLGQPWLRVFLMAEHNLCAQTPDMLENTRTTHSLWIVRLFAWNMPYHAEHHASPGIPFHRLPSAHELLGAHLRVVAPGYLAVQSEIFQALGSPP